MEQYMRDDGTDKSALFGIGNK